MPGTPVQRAEDRLSSLTLRRLEPLFPVVLGAHGVAIVLVEHHPSTLLPVYGLVVLLGVVGLLGWTSRTAVITRAVTCTGVALGVQLAEPLMVSSMLQWYYCVAAVYALMLRGAAAALVGPIVAVCFLVQNALIAGMSAPVAVLRAGVLTALGLITYRAGAAYLHATRTAENRHDDVEQAAVLLAHQATHDELTGLPNRVLFRSCLQESVDAAAGEGTALLLLDLDRFKEVNDTLGHRYGDLLLQQVAERLQAAVSDGDTVARLGGDEFAVVLPGARDAADAVVAAEAMRAALAAPFQVLEAVVVVDVSIGVALAPEHGTDDHRLLQHADVAMYLAKGAGLGVAVYDRATDLYAVDRLSLLADLRRAVESDELVVHYQPQIDLGTGLPIGMEALVRWQHPEQGLLMPDTFIPLAERSGLIERLTAVVLDDALAQCRRWSAQGRPMAVSVNLSARSLNQLDLPQRIAEALTRWQVPAELLELEITESFLMADPLRAQALLRQVHRMGVRLAIDDFGTGLSSLSYLKDLPVDVLKVDKSFVRHMTSEPKDVLILRGVVQLATGLGLRTVAEGVEDAGALQVLTDMGCSAAQGYYIGRPMPVDGLDAWLAARPLPQLAAAGGVSPPAQRR